MIKHEWKKFPDKLPEDNQTVFVINLHIKMLPIRAYFEAESHIFICLETYDTIPIAVTHWIDLPEFPKE